MSPLLLILLVVVLIAVLGGGYGYRAGYGGPAFGGIGLIIVVLLVLYLLGVFH